MIEFSHASLYGTITAAVQVKSNFSYFLSVTMLKDLLTSSKPSELDLFLAVFKQLLKF